jgi:hypothetical protein
MKNILTPRSGVYELYWHFIAERQAIFERRHQNIPPLWTADPVLQNFKFTNVFRAADRVSQYLIKEICYNNASTDRDKLFQIIMFRIFSNINTWEQLKIYLNHPPNINDLVTGNLKNALNKIKESGQKLYTSAFILCATNAYGQKFKHLNHCEMLIDMFIKHDIYNDIITARSLRQVYELLHTYPLMGDFMSYQIAIDINYSELTNFDENDFVKAGPGALRGIAKCFESTGNLTPEEVILWIVKHQDHELKRLDLKFNGLFGRKLHAIDAQNCFCEIDKYCRAVRPDLKSNRTKIKTKYQQTNQPIKWFFPPKWNIKS